MLKSSLCYYSDSYILVRGTIGITRHRNENASKRVVERNNGVIFKMCAPFRDCISEINNTQINNVKYIAVVMLMYLI